MTERDRLSAAQPYPAPVALEPSYARHRPSVEMLRAALIQLTAVRDWPMLSWQELIEALLSLGRTDVPLSRLAEGHLDALHILDQGSRVPRPAALYGVWASRSRRTGVLGRWRGADLVLNGTIRFASGAGLLDRALVPVWLDESRHLLVDLAVADLPVDSADWVTSAMEVSRSHTVRVEEVAVDASAVVGEDSFYLSRAQFFPGGVGVAACWAGGAARVTDLLLDRPAGTFTPAVQRRLGEIRSDLTAAAALVRGTADRLDELLPRRGAERPYSWQALATETRSATADAVNRILANARRVAGAAGFAHDEDLSRAIHDLDLYVLQQSPDSDAAYLGQLLTDWPD